MDSVEALPLRVMVISTPREPLVRTMLFCTEKPSCTCATSFMYTVAPLTVLMGRLFRSSRAMGLLLTRTWYSVFASLAVPAGGSDSEY